MRSRTVRAPGIFFALGLTQTNDVTVTNNVGRTLDLDVEAVEKVEAELDRFVEKRAREKTDADKVEEFWADQDRRHLARRRNALRWEWCWYHRHMETLHAGLAAEHADKRARLLAEGGYEPPSPEAA